MLRDIVWSHDKDNNSEWNNWYNCIVLWIEGCPVKEKWLSTCGTLGDNIPIQNGDLQGWKEWAQRDNRWYTRELKWEQDVYSKYVFEVNL